MWENQITWVLVGTILSALLMAVGGFLGFRLAKRRANMGGMTAEDRDRMRHLLLELGDWTSEYSGNVADYQDQLGRIEEAVRNSADGSGSGNRVLILLQQIMTSNEQLKSRLEAAEKQLEKQTVQIESYLTEARTDGLTGLANRRAFDQKLEQLFAAYRKGGRSFALAIIDIDKFKSINDTHGHQVGDQVLQRLASALTYDLDSALLVARFGGEEFAVLLNGPLQIAAEKMNAFRRDFSRQRVEIGPVALKVTMSIGVTEPRDDAVVAPIIRRADEALYSAKNTGRNRVYYHDGRSISLVGAPEVVR